MPPELFEIKRAQRKRARLRLAVCAASNGGKTYTSVELGFGIVQELLDRHELTGTLEGKVAVVDTERESAELYAHLGPFDTIQLGPPYTVERYSAAMDQLERAGFVVIILDSISHAWAGSGGVLALLDTFEDRERFRAFGSTINPAQDEFVDRILRSPCHVICTMRSKTQWVLQAKDKGGRTVMEPKRIGMAPVQRPGIEYEFTTLLDLDTDTHAARVVKNRCPVFADWKPARITREHGRQLAAWLLEGAPGEEAPVSGTPLERATARKDAGVRACQRAENVPDLARVFADCWRELQAFKPRVTDEELQPLLDELLREKDTRKAGLGGERQRGPIDTQAGEPPAPAPASKGFMQQPIRKQDEDELRKLIQDAGIRVAEVLERYSVVRLAEIQRDRFEEVRDWLREQVLAHMDHANRQPATTGAGGQSHFADMEDDLPWKE